MQPFRPGRSIIFMIRIFHEKLDLNVENYVELFIWYCSRARLLALYVFLYYRCYSLISAEMFRQTLIIHADDSRGSKTFIRVCLSVCVNSESQYQ